jgi:hypothetical protein
MPMEANAAAVSTVMPAAPSRIEGGRTVQGVQERGGGDSSAAFSQRTNVSIETTIDTLADVLSKISGRQQSSVEQMPQELKAVIQNIIRQSFSLETTLAQGLGSTAASQRFSTDQLTTLSRMLNQLGSLADLGAAPQVSDDLAAVLAKLKSAIAQETGGTFEPVMLTKAAFQLLDTGKAQLLPKELRAFLENLNTQNAQGNNLPSGSAQSPSGTPLGVLTRLVQSLMPRAPMGTDAAAPQPGSTQTQGGTPTQANMIPTPAQQGANPMPAQQNMMSGEAQPEQSAMQAQPGSDPAQGTVKGQPAPETAQQSAAGKENVAQGIGTTQQGERQPAPLPAQVQSASENGTPAQQSAAARDVSAQGQTNAAQPSGQEARPQTSGQGAPPAAQTPQQTAQGAPQTAQAQPAGQTPRGDTPPAGNTAQGTSGRPDAATAQQGTPRAQSAAQTSAVQGGVGTQPLENTPQMMQTMRAAARALLHQNENLSQREVQLLQNFVSSRNSTLSDADAAQLRRLIDLVQQNVPGTIRQAAIEQRMPDLPRLWAFMQTADMLTTRKMTAEQYKRAGRNVAALALSMRGAIEGENAAPQPGQRSMNFVMPLFMGEAEYPAYIHVYDESHADEGSDQIKKETWLRICVLTDHIGTVELINRIYEETHVDMRLYFSDPDAAWEFRNHLDDIRASAEDTPLVIEGIQIGAIGERRFFTN